ASVRCCGAWRRGWRRGATSPPARRSAWVGPSTWSTRHCPTSSTCARCARSTASCWSTTASWPRRLRGWAFAHRRPSCRAGGAWGAGVVGVVDRWRSLDREGVEACRTAGRVLQVLGERELAWDYLTTPVALRPNEAGPWQELGQALARRGDLDLADRAFRAAAESEPTNAQLLWDRADNPKPAGRADDARRAYPPGR